MSILFAKQPDGSYRAQIEDLEVKITPVGYEIVVWDELSEAPCEYDGCQGEYDTEAECVEAHGGTCPMEEKTRQQASNELVGGLSGWEEVEKTIRNRFRTLRFSYPRAAALRFAKEEWSFTETVHRKGRTRAHRSRRV